MMNRKNRYLNGTKPALIMLKGAGLLWPFLHYIYFFMMKSSVLRYSKIVNFKAIIYNVFLITK